MSELLPEGIDDIRDCPHNLFEQIRVATIFLSFEELPKDERPPKKIWLDFPALDAHFAGVERAREARWGKDGQEPIEDPVENDAVKAMMGGD